MPRAYTERSYFRYVEIFAGLLNDSTSTPVTEARILSPTTVAQLFTNWILDTSNFAYTHMPSVKPELVYPTECLYPLPPPLLIQGKA